MSYHQSYNHLLTDMAESSDFWGTWCQPCIESIPMVRQANLALKANQKVIFISIANEQKHIYPHKVAKTAAKLGIEWIQLIEHLLNPHSLARKLGIKGFPTLLIVNPENEIIWESLGNEIADTLINLKSILKLQVYLPGSEQYLFYH